MFGAALFMGGLQAETRLLRLTSVLAFGATTLKVFLLDTQGLDTVAQMILSLIFGSPLLATSHAYRRRVVVRLTALSKIKTARSEP
ncbi:MAG: hypothetical protein J07HQW2_02904 [Haloquadratum walsbyi J07HQW2]|jgi:hypothetical protein|uniref:Uncharacterized protein n=2 Tax=Haloquadratum walsbyi TaxID=293091 RepID=U1NH17_9EURY|nr:MAG: hypothetical protein J07HQW2_02904 [Haloquadratum walsbyi J07HQW2]